MYREYHTILTRVIFPKTLPKKRRIFPNPPTCGETHSQWKHPSQRGTLSFSSFLLTYWCWALTNLKRFSQAWIETPGFSTWPTWLTDQMFQGNIRKAYEELWKRNTKTWNNTSKFRKSKQHQHHPPASVHQKLGRICSAAIHLQPDPNLTGGEFSCESPQQERTTGSPDDGGNDGGSIHSPGEGNQSIPDGQTRCPWNSSSPELVRNTHSRGSLEVTELSDFKRKNRVTRKNPKMIIFSRKTHGCWVPPF